MDISSGLSGTKEFRIVKRGYDPDEVNAFLDQIALGVGELKRKLADAEDAAKAARRAAESTPPPAPAPAPAQDAEAEEIHRALILAQRAADEEVRKATEEGESLVASARKQAEELRADVEAELARRRDEGRAGLLAEIEELERVRDSLSSDVTVLERHVEEQREVVQAAIGELQSLLDHPEAFRVATETGVSTTSPPIDRDPTPAPAPVPDDVAPPTGEAEGVDLPGKADLSAALEDADDEAPEPPPPALRSDGAPPAPPAATDRPPPPAEETVRIGSPPPPPPPPAPDLFSGPRGGDEDDRDLGPPTEAVATVGAADPDEDAFLAELRKAMLDDEPLGPRDASMPGGPDDDAAGGRARPRFGRRR
ncbi:DivIVA domain-containing protein [Iamia sp. SCSIO 61187]|uniref:DivIVA domain-containing protein n=1 Tax=Iamia sp. SCSIO 61187 TaxID=2722752 RepID=UPI001C62A7C4|nr:DivIVA domain-containing protein [Iamia sp. SCSIO 61187]QYG92806.1 DivIVA domain-containing protein [Iamia sp. SCSIO 61187]